jgi:uncharacterized Zn-binding protein involved in type VI secretion
MPQLGLAGKSLVGPGIDLGPGAATVFAEGAPVSVVGDSVSPHGEPPHVAATIISGSATVFAEGKPVVVQGLSTASCAHVVNTGAATVQVT